ncbi:MAG: TetR/AcrR family transcriptional regulator [Saprospiraceae bacterium]
MKEDKRLKKEQHIIDHAFKVFEKVGFKNAKMDDIAASAGITKVTLYSYFQSKENLYLAITFQAMTELNKVYQTSIEKNANNTGLESTLALLETFMEFCEQNYLYSEVLLEYFAMVRSTSADKNSDKLTEAAKDSFYFHKLLELHNLPFKWTVKEIERGKKDGSIKTTLNAMVCTLHGWTMVIGYVKIVAASGDNATPLFNVNLKELKNLHLSLARTMFGIGLIS